MRATCTHVQTAILRAVAAEAGLDPADREKPVLVVEDVRSVDWASATFVGARHEIALRIEGEADAASAAVDRLRAGLAEREIPIVGHIVAEISVNLVNIDKRNVNIRAIRLTVNALTIID